MNWKWRLFWAAVISFSAYYLFTSPAAAGGTVTALFRDIKEGFHSVAVFFSSLGQ